MEDLIGSLTILASDLPVSDLRKVLSTLTGLQNASDARASSLVGLIPSKFYKEKASRMLRAWRSHVPEMPGAAVALALESAARATQDVREKLSVELVWTGPSTPRVPLRRTDQVLLDFIQDTEEELWIICYAVHKVVSVREALKEAVNRGVMVRMLLESADESGGRLSHDSLDSLREEFGQDVRFFIWPRDQRPVNDKGKHGALHAKCTVSDRQRLLVSSANLTEFAMTFNMELGVALYSPDLARRVVEHFEMLRERGVIVSV